MISDIGFVGFGLIAGSIAKAIRLKHPDFNRGTFITGTLLNRRIP